MKKIPFFLILLLIFSQCSKSNDDGLEEDPAGDPVDEGVETFLFGINIVGDYFDENFTGHVYLSDEEGNLFADAALVNNEEVSLNAVFDLNNTYDATIITTISAGGERLFQTKTFENVRPNTYSLIKTQLSNPNGDQVFLNMFNTGFPLEVLTTSGNSYGVSGSSQNGGAHEFRGALAASPGDYFASFKSPNDSFPRYFWLENTEADTMLTLDYSSLPLSDNVVTTSYPSNSDILIMIDGLRFNDVNRIAHPIEFERFEFGSTTNDVLLPDEIFDYYRFNSFFTIGNSRYSVSKITESIDTMISTPNLDIDITNQSVGNFSMSTTGGHTAFNVNYLFNDAQSGNYVQYEVYGDSAVQVGFSKTNLFDQLFGNIPEISSNGLELARASIVRNSTFSSYSQYVKSVIEFTVDSTLNSVVVGVSKSE